MIQKRRWCFPRAAWRYAHLKECFYWIGMYKNVLNYILGYDLCQHHKTSTSHPADLLWPLQPPPAPFYSWNGFSWPIPISKVWKLLDYCCPLLHNTRYAETRALTMAHAALSTRGLQRITLKPAASLINLIDPSATCDLCMLPPITAIETMFITFAYNSSQDTTEFSAFYLLYGHGPSTPLLRTPSLVLKKPVNSPVYACWIPKNASDHATMKSTILCSNHVKTLNYSGSQDHRLDCQRKFFPGTPACTTSFVLSLRWLILWNLLTD